MGVISEYAAGTGAEGASDPGVQADVANDLMAKPGSCPTCGQAMPVSKIAKKAGFPVTPPAATTKDEGVPGAKTKTAAQPEDQRVRPPPKYPVIGVRG